MAATITHTPRPRAARRSLLARARDLAGALALALPLATLAVGPTAAGAAGGEVPNVTLQALAPGAVAVNYEHSGTGRVLWYAVERKDGGRAILYSPNGQFIDMHLAPDTAYEYRVCAFYEGQEPGEEACSAWQAARTLPAPGRPANFDPPTITDFEVTPDAIA